MLSSECVELLRVTRKPIDFVTNDQSVSPIALVLHTLARAFRGALARRHVLLAAHGVADGTSEGPRFSERAEGEQQEEEKTCNDFRSIKHG